VGLTIWVNHIAFTADAERQQQAKASLSAGGVEPLMDVDHGWCHSIYYVDPNGIMIEFCRDTPGFTPELGRGTRRTFRMTKAGWRQNLQPAFEK
jgi:catechol-2,3-dioxygenase